MFLIRISLTQMKKGLLALILAASAYAQTPSSPLTLSQLQALTPSSYIGKVVFVSNSSDCQTSGTPTSPTACTVLPSATTWTVYSAPSWIATTSSTPALLQSTSSVAEGDSITYGTGASGHCNGGFSLCHYAALLAYDQNAALTDRGVSGAQACDMADAQTIKYDLSAQDHNAIYSQMILTNDAWNGGVGAYEAVAMGCQKAAISWDAVWNKVAANSTNCTDTGSWTSLSGYALVGESSTTNGSTKSCSITTYGEPLYVWYQELDSNGGTFTYAVDGGATVSVTTATTPAISTTNGGHKGWNLIRVPVAAGSHTILFTVTSATSASNSVGIAAIGTPTNSLQTGYYSQPTVTVMGVLREQGDAASAATAEYDADAQADVKLFVGDGLNVLFVPVRNFVCTSVVSGTCYNQFGVADMENIYHPSSVGHNEIKMAVESVEQFISAPMPNNSNATTMSGCGTGATLNGTGARGHIVLGTSPGTCTVTFPTATVYSSTPVCAVSGEAGQVLYTVSNSAITMSTVPSSGGIDYVCEQ